MRVGVELYLGELVGLLAGQGVKFGDALDLVAEQRDAPGPILKVGGKHFD